MSLHVENLRIYYQTLHGNAQALDGVTFSIQDGEIMGLAGESGCGKTTLGYSLVHLTPPKKYMGGAVRLDGEELPIWDNERMIPFRYERVSIIPQYAMSALNPTRKIGRMIGELLETRKVAYSAMLPELRRRLDLVGLSPDVLTLYPIELSGGMKQRMVMVLSTLLNPSLLVADEVTSALDVSNQKAVSEMLVQFRNAGFVKSMIVVTHDISVLYQIADSITIMYAGKLAEKAPTEVIVNAPRHPYTRLLISSLPEIGVKYSEKRLTGIPGNPPLLINPPTGCRFRDRCPVAFEKCVEEPPFIEVEKGHHVACWKELGSHA
ncbi:MAG TPA: ABC transporter ATP-binding protein [Anaerolineaceae bacterium]|nr:ABC transporter ATP-binding protein [Anaerolineaceae bacterium]